jgi:hypothetical protein
VLAKFLVDENTKKLYRKKGFVWQWQRSRPEKQWKAVNEKTARILKKFDMMSTFNERKTQSNSISIRVKDPETRYYFDVNIAPARGRRDRVAVFVRGLERDKQVQIQLNMNVRTLQGMVSRLGRAWRQFEVGQRRKGV